LKKLDALMPRNLETSEAKVFRIIDANVNRAMEGLRVVEEVVRFILEDKRLTLRLKELRSCLKSTVNQIPRDKLISSRASLTDVGGKLYTKSEKNRKSILAIYRSNIKRIEEAVRVLEEFSKLVEPKLGKNFKAIRFELYDFEKQIQVKL